MPPGTSSFNRVTTSSVFGSIPLRIVITGTMTRAFTTGDLKPHSFDPFHCFGGTNICAQPEPFFGLQMLDASGNLVGFVGVDALSQPPFSSEHRYALTPIVAITGPISFLAWPVGNPDVGSPVFSGAFQVEILDARSCDGRVVTIDTVPGFPTFGTPGDDVILGTEEDDQLFGRGGNDVICGLGGNDVILGNSGEDRLFGGPGDDQMLGGDDKSADVLQGDEGRDRLVGGGGNDLLYGGPDADKLLGGPGLDQLIVSEGGDIISGGRGRDLADYSLLPGPVKVFLEQGKQPGGEILRGIESLLGSPGNDILIGNDAGNSIDGGDGNDHLNGRGGLDALSGGPGFDVCLITGSDTIVECEIIE